MSIVQYDLDEEYKNALNKELDKESRLFSISLMDYFHPLDELTLDEDEDVDIRIASLDHLAYDLNTLYDINIDKVPKELALAIIERYYFEGRLKDIALNHQDSDYRLKALENKYLNDEDALKHIIENESESRLRVAAAKHPNLNDSAFLEELALNDDDVDVRESAVSNYSTKDISVLKKVISDDEDVVRIAALENLVFKYNLFFPSSNKKYNFKRKFNKLSRSMIEFNEGYVPKQLSDDEMDDLMDFELWDRIYSSSVSESYPQLRDYLIEFLDKDLGYIDKYDPFVESEDGSYKKKLYDDLNLVYGDDKRLFLYQMAYDGTRGNLKYYLEYLASLEIEDSYDDAFTDNRTEGSYEEKQIEESYFIDLAYADSNDEMVRIAIEAISDNSVLADFIENGKTKEIKKTAIKRSTDLPYLVNLAINRIDKDIMEAQFFDDDWICDYVSRDLDYFANFGFSLYDFYSHDIDFYKQSFDNRLSSFYYDAIAELYYKDSFSFCIFKKIENYFDLIHILKNTRSFVLRDLILYKIENPIILAGIALNAIDERIRYTAFGRIDSKQTLNFVYSRTDDFRIKILYLSSIDNPEILEAAFLKEENDVLRRTILENHSFKITPKVIECCLNENSYISSFAEKKFAEQFVNYRLMNKKFL